MSGAHDAASMAATQLARSLYSDPHGLNETALSDAWAVIEYVLGSVEAEHSWPPLKRAQVRVINLETARDQRGEFLTLRREEPCWRCRTPTTRLDIDWQAPWCAQKSCLDAINHDLEMANKKLRVVQPRLFTEEDLDRWGGGGR